MPTGSNRTTCLSAMNSLANYVLRTGTGHTSVQEEEPRTGASAAGPAALLPGFLRYRSAAGGPGPSRRAAPPRIPPESPPPLPPPLVLPHLPPPTPGPPTPTNPPPHTL